MVATLEKEHNTADRCRKGLPDKIVRRARPAEASCTWCLETLERNGWLCPSHAGSRLGPRRPEALQAVRQALSQGFELDETMGDVRRALAALRKRGPT